MKIRSGFVSNSSSSSFVIIGIPVLDVSTLTEAQVENEELIALGHELGEGQDVFVVTKEMLPVIKEGKFDLEFLVNAKWLNDYSIPKITDDMVGKIIRTGESDYHGTHDVASLIERYGEQEERY